MQKSFSCSRRFDSFERAIGLTLLGFSFSCVPIVTTRVGSLNEVGGFATFSYGGAVFRPSACYSGARSSFLGVDLIDEEAHVGLRLAIDPIDGPRLRWTRYDRAGNKVDVAQFPSCSALSADVHPTSWRVNDIQDYSGQLNAVCANDTKELKADLRFEHCH